MRTLMTTMAALAACCLSPHAFEHGHALTSQPAHSPPDLGGSGQYLALKSITTASTNGLGNDTVMRSDTADDDPGQSGSVQYGDKVDGIGENIGARHPAHPRC